MLKARDGVAAVARPRSAVRVCMPLGHLVGFGNVLDFENGWAKNGLMLL